MTPAEAPARTPRGSFLEVLAVFTKLGLTSFGGPVAHLGYFRDELIARRGWISDESYTDLVALCQFLPGPASSQTGIGLGIARAGIPGGFAAWLGFTLPSAFALIAFAFGVSAVGDVGGAGWLQGLKIVAVAVVADALWGMATKLTPDRPRITLAVAAAEAALVWPTSLAQVAIILVGGLVGWRLLQGSPVTLQAEVVPPGWVDNATFTAGYGAAQAVPGPLFTFSAFLGAVTRPGLEGFGTGLLALVAVFAPSFLLLLGVLPFWDRLRLLPPVQAALRGVNAAVVGILLAALYDPVWTSAIFTGADFAVALGAFLVLAFWRWPAWLVVLLTALAGAAVSALL